MGGDAWRLLLDPAGSAAWNMSVDEALLLHVGEAGPTLRFYTWERPSVSLGYRQRRPEWLRRCEELGVDVVRRVSGGGAVLHAGDLTYCVTAPAPCADLPDGLEASTTWIRDVLISGLQDLGLEVEPSAGVGGAERSPLCFHASTGTEIELATAKLVGSAQRRAPWGFLQHGSLRLTDDSELYHELFGASPPAPLTAEKLTPGEVALALSGAFGRALGRSPRPAQLSDTEDRESHSRQRRRGEDPLEVPQLSLRREGNHADSLP
jgi:lipoate-protein ligase A